MADKFRPMRKQNRTINSRFQSWFGLLASGLAVVFVWVAFLSGSLALAGVVAVCIWLLAGVLTVAWEIAVNHHSWPPIHVLVAGIGGGLATMAMGLAARNIGSSSTPAGRT